MPVDGGRTRQELTAILDSVFADNTNAWELAGDGSWQRPRTGKGERVHSPPGDAPAPRDAPRPAPARGTRPHAAGAVVQPSRRRDSVSMQVAIIDIGSNTARLLVAEVDARRRSRRDRAGRRASRAGRGAGKREALTDEKIDDRRRSSPPLRGHGANGTTCGGSRRSSRRRDAGRTARVSPRAVGAATGWPVRDPLGRRRRQARLRRRGRTRRGSAGGRRRRRRRRRLERDRGGNTAARRRVGQVADDRLAAPDPALPAHRPTDAAEVSRPATSCAARWTASSRRDPTRPGRGGSARAVAKVIGRVFGPDDLEEVVRSRRAVRRATIARASVCARPGRRPSLPGAIVLAEMSRLFEQPFTLAGGGLREGAALVLATAAKPKPAAA